MHPGPLQPLDLLVALKLATRPAQQSIRALASALGVPKSSVGVSVAHLKAWQLATFEDGQWRINRVRFHDLLEHGIRWLAPADVGRWVLGLPTAHAASVLASKLPGDSDPLVMPLDEGPTRGRAVTPLHPAAGLAASKDPKLRDLLALVDAIRIGTARERGVAASELRSRI
jgi:hypothetical protein